MFEDDAPFTTDRSFSEQQRARDWRKLRRLVAAGGLLACVLVGALVFAAGTEPPGIPAAIRNAVRAPSTYITARVLAANVAETVTAPTFATYPSAKAIGVFSATCSNFYYNVTATAAAPAADVTDGSAAGRAPSALKLAQGGTVSIVADNACIVTIEWYVEREP